MSSEEFDCLPESIVGPINMKKVEKREAMRIEDFPETLYDKSYLQYIEKNHGGIPKKQWFKSEDGAIHRLGRFINLGGPFKEPFQESWEYAGEDIRDHWNISSMECIANIADGCGAYLVPFGILYSGEHHPDQMGVTYANLVCFDYSAKDNSVPKIVYWDNSKAVDECFACLDDGRDEWTEKNHDTFTTKVSNSFDEFLKSLKETNYF